MKNPPRSRDGHRRKTGPKLLLPALLRRRHRQKCGSRDRQNGRFCLTPRRP